VQTGRDPAVLVEELGVGRAEDSDLVDSAIAEILAAHPGELQRFRDGDGRLMGFFMGKSMRALRGRADGSAVRASLIAQLKG